MRGISIVSLLALVGAACGPGGSPPEAESSWVGTITTEGNVTTVVNQSGSVWGGDARLVEELSIGVASGDEPYMFGPIIGLGVTDDRIYVADDLLYAVRVYDHDGKHLFDFGREGEGPGEFDDIRKLAVDPTGRVLVQGANRVNVFDLDGVVLGSWPYRSNFQDALSVAIDGTAFVPTSWNAGDDRAYGVIAVDPEGTEVARLTGPVFDSSPWGLVARQGGRVTGALMLYAPTVVWAPLPSGAVAEGISDAYRFTIKRPDGSSVVVGRAIDLPSAHPDYAAWYTAWTTALMRRTQPDWQWTAGPVPERKPAFRTIAGDRYGRVWVMRALGTEAVSDCDADPASVTSGRAVACWRDQLGFDVFEEETGRFLGRVPLPHEPRFPAPPVFLEDAVVLVREDEAGTIMVKRYRLVLPG